ncbi:hypothetical protein BRADI_2g27948v3 [Brachypodium distachyon]|uniref:Uncharacterized protein n=1 Tax=Brachypodium distachyon TaxID=15368 RepID=A0A0Q3MR02_BRADI|nr:hypothetical protein BRADI_2g27948v3 [Brachypodium distachyon]
MSEEVPAYELARRERMRQNNILMASRGIPTLPEITKLARSIVYGTPRHADVQEDSTDQSSNYDPTDDEEHSNEEDEPNADARPRAKVRNISKSTATHTSTRSTRSTAKLLLTNPTSQTEAQPHQPRPSPTSRSHVDPCNSRGSNSPVGTPANDSQGISDDIVPATTQDSQPILLNKRRGRRRETMGHGLQDYSRRNGGAKMHIEFKEGKSRPPDPNQASKLSSECGIHIRKNMPLVRHWKEYKDKELKNVVPNAIKSVANKFDMDKDSELAQDVCTRIIQKGVRNHRYKLKRDYFTKVSPNKRLANVPPKMSQDNWELLCNRWSNPDFQRLCAKNKQNREGVRQHQCTGSRSYVAHLTFSKAKYNNEEPDVVDFYKESHTKKDGSMSANAAVAHSAMQAKQMECQSDGATVLRETSSSSTFLANLGFPASLRRPPTASARKIQELQERLHTQERDAGEAQERQQEQFSSRLQTQQMEIEDLRRRQQEELEEIRKKHQEEIENMKNSQQEKNGALEKKQQEMDAVLGYLLRQQAQASATSSAIPNP